MDHALKEILAPSLRERGFTGSLPHFRRRATDRISLLSVQHFSSGGSFVVEVAVCSPVGLVTSWGKEIGPAKVTATDISAPRPLLGAADFPGRADHWFVYGPRNYEDQGHRVQSQSHYSAIADQVVLRCQ